MIRRICLVIVTASILMGSLGTAIAQDDLQITYDDGRAAEFVPAWQFISGGDDWYLRANDVARLFKATQFWNASSRKVVLGVGRSRFILTVDTRVVVIDGEPLLLRSAVKYDGGFVMIPMEFIIEVAAQYTPRAFVWNERDLSLHVSGLGYNVERIELTSTGNRTTAAISLAEPLLYHMDTETSGLVRLKLYGGRIDKRLFTVRDQHGLVEGVRAEQTDRDAFIYFDIKNDTRRIRIEREDDPPRLTLVLEKGDLPDIPDADYQGPDVVVVDRDSAERRTFEITKICIDPGHGGLDTGKTSSDGLSEKDVNLAIAEVVARELRDQLGLEVVMTREDDRLLSLTERTEIANEAGADLFVSIHCNSWFSEHTGGFEAYFLSPARSESEKTLARFENAAGEKTTGTPTNDVDFIVWDLMQNKFINESSTFAEFIQRAMDDRLEIRSRGVKQANFMVLKGARMPAVLIEVAFLSNPDEQRMLADTGFHARVADGMVESVRRLRERYR